MTNWNVVKDNVVIDSIVAESKDFVEELYSDCTILEDDGFVGIGWTNTDGSWKAQYPTDDLEYHWNEEFKVWELSNAPEEVLIVEE